MYQHLTDAEWQGIERVVESEIWRFHLPADVLDDARQEAYIAVLRARPLWSADGGATLHSWCRIAVRTAICSWIRKTLGRAGRRPRSVTYWADYDKTQSHNAAIPESVLMREMLEAVERLGWRYRKVLHMFAHDEPAWKMAESLGVHVARVYQLKDEAIGRVRSQMGIAA